MRIWTLLGVLAFTSGCMASVSVPVPQTEEAARKFLCSDGGYATANAYCLAIILAAPTDDWRQLAYDSCLTQIEVQEATCSRKLSR